MNNNTIIRLENINKKFDDKIIFNNLNFSINKGDVIAFVGESGKGKTTLLNIIGLLEKFDSGKYYLYDEDISNIKEHKKRSLFKRTFAYLFQNFALIDNKTVFYNLKIALLNPKDISKISEVLTIVGLKDYENKKVFQLSGGEQQRVALARLILRNPEIILCDEPTGSLDNNNRDMVLQILSYFKKKNKTIIIVTHDEEVAKWCNKIYRI